MNGLGVHLPNESSDMFIRNKFPNFFDANKTFFGKVGLFTLFTRLMLNRHPKQKATLA